MRTNPVGPSMTFSLRRAALALALPSSLSLFAIPAAADQCAWIDASAATTAVKVLTDHPEVRLYCAPCNDKTVTSFTVKRAEVAPATSGGKVHPYNVVRITNDAGQSKEIDLAYTYVQLDPKSPIFTNLAQLASCPTVDVPATIRDEGSSAKKKTQSR